MTEQEFKRFMHSATPETPRGIDLQDQRPRTLIYGYTVDRHSFHLYLDEECRLQRVIYDHHDVLLSTCSEKHLTWHDCRPDKRAYPESCDLEFCEMLELAGIDLPFIRFDAERAYQLQDTPFHGKQASELKKRAEASPSTNPAYVLYSDTLGVYLGNVLGLGFWSKLDPFGQGGAPTFESPDRVRVVIERKPFGRLVIQEEGRAYFGETYQRMFLESHTRLPDKINEVLPDMLAAEERALKKPAKGPRPG